MEGFDTDEIEEAHSLNVQGVALLLELELDARSPIRSKGAKTLDSKMVSIANKQELYNYFINDFANLFFTKDQYI